jgi:hypothetical protein
MTTSKFKPIQETAMELIERAIAALDVEIAELQAKRAQLIALTGKTVVAFPTPAEVPPKRTMSEEARAKISAAAKKRWAKKKKAAQAAIKSMTKAGPATASAATKKASSKAKKKVTTKDLPQQVESTT